MLQVVTKAPRQAQSIEINQVACSPSSGVEI